MSASKADKSRFWITFLTDDLNVGDQFTPKRLHITVIPWFVSELDDRQLIASFEETFRNLSKISVEIGPQVQFGPNGDVTVNLINNPESLSAVQQISLDWFKRVNGRWAVKNPYVGDEYSPHIRRRERTDINQGDNLNLNYVYLIAAKRSEDQVREVAAKVALA